MTFDQVEALITASGITSKQVGTSSWLLSAKPSSDLRAALEPHGYVMPASPDSASRSTWPYSFWLTR